MDTSATWTIFGSTTISYLWLLWKFESHLLDMNSCHTIRLMIKCGRSTFIKPTSKLQPCHCFIHWQHLCTNVLCLSAPPYINIQTTRYLTKMWLILTCCGLQKQQGDETADWECTLHDGCQENSDSHRDYIYQGKKVKGHEEKRGGARQLVEGLRSVCALCIRGVVRVIACHRDSTCTNSWLSFLERLQLIPLHQCKETWGYFQCWRHAQGLSDGNNSKYASETEKHVLKRITLRIDYVTLTCLV